MRYDDGAMDYYIRISSYANCNIRENHSSSVRDRCDMLLCSYALITHTYIYIYIHADIGVLVSRFVYKFI